MKSPLANAATDCGETQKPIEIHTLGRFTIALQGEPIEFDHKSPRKLLDFLKALIALGGREIDEELLSDALWYDADGDAAHSSFATTLHRLRKLLGYKRAIRIQAGRATLNPEYCWVDVWALERLLSQIETERKVGDSDPTSHFGFYKRIVQLYQGPFLGNEREETWIVPMREHLRDRLLRCLFDIGNLLAANGMFENALVVYQKGLEIDNLAEAFYQQLIICNAFLGRRAEALKLYERCQINFSRQLGIEPSSDTRALCIAVRADDMGRLAEAWRSACRTPHHLPDLLYPGKDLGNL